MATEDESQKVVSWTKSGADDPLRHLRYPAIVEKLQKLQVPSTGNPVSMDEAIQIGRQKTLLKELVETDGKKETTDYNNDELAEFVKTRQKRNAIGIADAESRGIKPHPDLDIQQKAIAKLLPLLENPTLLLQEPQVIRNVLLQLDMPGFNLQDALEGLAGEVTEDTTPTLPTVVAPANPATPLEQLPTPVQPGQKLETAKVKGEEYAVSPEDQEVINRVLSHPGFAIHFWSICFTPMDRSMELNGFPSSDNPDTEYKKRFNSLGDRAFTTLNNGTPFGNIDGSPTLYTPDSTGVMQRAAHELGVYEMVLDIPATEEMIKGERYEFYDEEVEVKNIFGVMHKVKRQQSRKVLPSSTPLTMADATTENSTEPIRFLLYTAGFNQRNATEQEIEQNNLYAQRPNNEPDSAILEYYRRGTDITALLPVVESDMPVVMDMLHRNPKAIRKLYLDARAKYDPYNNAFLVPPIPWGAWDSDEIQGKMYIGDSRRTPPSTLEELDRMSVIPGKKGKKKNP